MELKPNRKQETLFRKGCGVARFSYNWGLARQEEQYKATGKYTNLFDLQKQLNDLKKTEFPWMYEVSKCIHQSALDDLDQGYKRFFKKIAGYPNKKKKRENK